MGDTMREAFERHVQQMPEWEPEFEQHRAWVMVLLQHAWNDGHAAGRQLGMEQARREPLTEPQIAAAFDRAGIGHQRGETILGKPWWSTRGSKSCVELTRAIERAHGITTPPAGDSDTQEPK